MRKEEFIRRHRWKMYGLFQATVHDILYGQHFIISHQPDFSEFRIYLDFIPSHWYVASFPADIVYINTMRGPRDFLTYVKNKLIIPENQLLIQIDFKAP